MKKYIALVLFLVPFSAFASFDNNLSYGSSGQSVLELQEFLGSQGLFNGPFSGYFFSLTTMAVKRFQAQQGISPTGYFGPISRARATDILNATAGTFGTTSTTTATTTAATSTSTPNVPTAPVTESAPVAPVVQPSPISLPTLQPTQMTQPVPTITCSLSVPTNTQEAGTLVDVTWTSAGATAAKLSNNHISYGNDGYGFDLEPVASGTRKVRLSSEPGEMNVLTATFLNGQETQVCSAQVLTK